MNQWATRKAAPTEIFTMAKYRRQEGIDTLQKEIESEMARGQPALPVQPEPVVAEDGSFKKRYGDLRRHSQQLMQQKDGEITQLKQQLDAAAKGQIRFPKTDEEIDAWAARYPDVAQIVDSIAQKRASEALEEGEKRMEGLKQLEQKLTRKEAEQQLLKDHPDFMKIRASQHFHDWVAHQPAYLQDALYKNNTDARAASRAIDLYKADRGKPAKGNKSAAQVVGRTTGTAPLSQGRKTYSESQVAKMSAAEYEKHEEDIMSAMQKGSFKYDLSGGAR